MELTLCHGRDHRKICIEDITDTIHVDKNPKSKPDIVADFLDQRFIDKFKYGQIKTMRFIGCPLINFRTPKLQRLLSLLGDNGQIIFYGLFEKSMEKNEKMHFYCPGIHHELYANDKTQLLSISEFFESLILVFASYGYIFKMEYVPDPAERDDRFIFTLVRKQIS
jgi:hypothetical protein